jgi:dethiobiotin synthetase
VNYFVTAIGTDSGKTLVSAILVEAFQADYYKPIQCGLETIDSETVESLLNNTYCMIHPSQFMLQTPASPHFAAKIEGVEINIADIYFPEVPNDLVIEGAGGLMVPINEKGEFIVDIIESVDCEVVLVSNNYLGSINHTILSINELKRRGVKVKGIVFNGESNPSTEKMILDYSGWPCLLRVRKEEVVNRDTVKLYALELMANLHNDQP